MLDFLTFMAFSPYYVFLQICNDWNNDTTFTVILDIMFFILISVAMLIVYGLLFYGLFKLYAIIVDWNLPCKNAVVPCKFCYDPPTNYILTINNIPTVQTTPEDYYLSLSMQGYDRKISLPEEEWREHQNINKQIDITYRLGKDLHIDKWKWA